MLKEILLEIDIFYLLKLPSVVKLAHKTQKNIFIKLLKAQILDIVFIAAVFL